MDRDQYNKLNGTLSALESLRAAQEKINRSIPRMTAAQALMEVRQERVSVPALDFLRESKSAMEAITGPAAKLAQITRASQFGRNPLFENAAEFATKNYSALKAMEFQNPALQAAITQPLAIITANQSLFQCQREITNLLGRNYFESNELEVPDWVDEVTQQDLSDTNVLEVIAANNLIELQESSEIQIEDQFAEIKQLLLDQNSAFSSELKEVHKVQKEVLEELTNLAENAKERGEQVDATDDPMTIWNTRVVETLETHFPNRFGLSRKTLFVCIHVLNYLLLLLLGNSLNAPLEDFYLLLNVTLKKES